MCSNNIALPYSWHNSFTLEKKQLLCSWPCSWTLQARYCIKSKTFECEPADGVCQKIIRQEEGISSQINHMQQSCPLHRWLKCSHNKILFLKNHLLLDFTQFGVSKQPIYFNTVRDPYDRFKSRYYWHRVDYQALRWFNNYHLIEPDPRGIMDFRWAVFKCIAACSIGYSDSVIVMVSQPQRIFLHWTSQW